MWTSVTPTAFIIAAIISTALSAWAIKRTAKFIVRVLPIPHKLVVPGQFAYCGLIFLAIFASFSYLLRTDSHVYYHLETAEDRIETIWSSLPKYGWDDLTDDMISTKDSLSDLGDSIGEQLNSFQTRPTSASATDTTYPITLTSRSLAAQYVIEQPTVEDRSILFKLDVKPMVGHTVNWSGPSAQQSGLSLYSMDDQTEVEIMNIGGVFNDTIQLSPDRKNFAWVRFHKPNSLRVRFSYGDMGTIDLDLNNLE